ncbi:hypothetical protein SESBI_02987 [Sesbania bispinosa]|nr:hypothetical protein SESBI_02987 [Sesbania bispinosa]
MSGTHGGEIGGKKQAHTCLLGPDRSNNPLLSLALFSELEFKPIRQYDSAPSCPSPLLPRRVPCLRLPGRPTPGEIRVDDAMFQRSSALERSLPQTSLLDCLPLETCEAPAPTHAWRRVRMLVLEGRELRLWREKAWEGERRGADGST